MLCLGVARSPPAGTLPLMVTSAPLLGGRWPTPTDRVPRFLRSHVRLAGRAARGRWPGWKEASRVWLHLNHTPSFLGCPRAPVSPGRWQAGPPRTGQPVTAPSPGVRWEGGVLGAL